MHDQSFSLRGGGCGVSQVSPNIQKNSKFDTQDIEKFISRIDFYVEIICQKAAIAANQQESQEIMIAIQWFVFQEEKIYQLSKNAQKVLKTYNLIVEGVRKLLKSCLIYIRSDQFKCLQILQITAALSKVIFSFHIINNERFMRSDLQTEFLDLSDELTLQIEIEKNNLIQIQIEFYLFLTKRSFEIAPNNSNERNEILKGCLHGIIGSITEMKPTAELIQSLFKGACLLCEMFYKLYALKKKRIQYEVYFQIDMLQWETISYFKNETQQNLDEVLEKIQAIHEQLVKNSNNWENHYLWIQMIGKILVYNPILTEQKLSLIAKSCDVEANSRQIWKEYQRKGLIIQMNHCQDQAVIQLNQFQNKKLIQIDRMILQDIFKEWEQFIFLKEYLLNEQNINVNFTLRSYLQNNFKIRINESSQNDYILSVCSIQKFFEFMISNKLINLIKENYEKLGIVYKTYGNIIKNSTMFNETKNQIIQNLKINKMIVNLKEFIQNNHNIMKLLQLNSKQQNYLNNQHEQQNELKNIQQLKYLMQVLEQILEQSIQVLQHKSDDENNNKNYETFEIVEIQQELIKLKLKHSLLDDFRKKILSFIDASLNQQNYLKTASSLIQLITNSWLELEKFEKLEISNLQNENQMIDFFRNQLNNLFFHYQNLNKELKNDYTESMLFLKQVIQFKYQFETFTNIQNLNQIELIKHVQKLRIKHLKLHFQLANIKKSFLNILEFANQKELSQLQQFVNLDGFLLSTVNNYPLNVVCSISAIDKLIVAELRCSQFTQQDYKNKLSNQKGSIEYLKFYLQQEEQIISSELQDLELFEQELGELFIDESSFQMSVERILGALSVEKLLKYLSDKNCNLSELIKEKGKFQNCLHELRKIQDSSINQNKNQVEIEYYNQLAIQIEKVIRTLGTLGTLDNEIIAILIKQELMNLVKLTELQDKQAIINQNNEKEEIQQVNNGVVIENSNHFNFFSDENRKTYLQLMIKLVKLQLLKIKEVKDLLHKLLQVIVTFSDNLEQIQSYEEEIQNNCFQIFQNRYKEFILNFEQLAITHVNLQQDQNQNIKLYFEKISFQLSTESNSTGITSKQQYISDFLNSLKLYFQEKLGKPYNFTISRINQELMIQVIRKLHLLENEKEDQDDKSYQDLGLIDTLNQKVSDFNNNHEWKIKQGLVFTMIYISSNSFTDTVIQFCQKTLIQLWALEKDQRVRNLLKNEKLINLQMQILKKNWQTQHDRIAGEMLQMLKEIDQLQEQISHEANLNKRNLQLKQMDKTTQQLEEYIENISEMGQKLSLMTDFINHIRKSLLRVEGKINEMKEQLNKVGDDINYLRGKSVEQLLEIRKWKVLKEAAYKNVKSIYVPLKTLQKGKEYHSELINLEQFDDRVGEVNEFFSQEEKTVMLIHGIAGSGKSTTAKKIEQFIWKLHENNQKIGNQVLIPIYISLPSLKNPVFQAVEETLIQDDYGFDNLQLKECKQKLEKKEFRFLLIMDSYDEMKIENIQKNLYLNNKVRQNWSNPLVIFTTRSEIFTSINYIEWFAPEEKNKFKEVQLLKFDKDQIEEYLKQYTMLSIKTLIFEIYEWQMQIKKRSVDINQFEQSWIKIQQQFLRFYGQNLKTDFLLTQKQIQSILAFLKEDEFIALKSNEALRSLSINFEKLWSISKYKIMMQQINSNKLFQTPYMMEIIVQVLPQIMTQASDLVNLKQNFIKNFQQMLKAFLKSNYLIQMYKSQQKQHLIQLANQIEDKNQEVTQSDVQNLEKIDYHLISLKFWDKIEDNSIHEKPQIFQELNQMQNLLIYMQEPILELKQKTNNKVEIKNECIISLVCDALKEQNLTSFDFYSEFINYYHLRQIEKQKNLGKSVNIDRFMHDLQIYSIRLAKIMSKSEITQVEYKQQGLLYKQEGEEQKWLDEFFNDDSKNGAYKKDIRSCSLVQKKGANFSFVHKSLQEFLIAADLYELLIKANEFDVELLVYITKRLQREQIQVQDGFELLLKLNLSELGIQANNLSLLERQQIQNNLYKKINEIINFIEQVKQHDFNLINYSTENYSESRKYLIQKISKDNIIIELLKILVLITKIDNKLIQSGSNSLNLLVEMKVDLTMQNFSNINIQNTSLIGGNFAKCNLNGSKFENVNMNGMNLNGAQLFNCQWKNLRINELTQLGNSKNVINQICFSPDGTTLASGSLNNSILIWDMKTGQQKSELDGHIFAVQSVCFSPDGTTLASGSRDKSIRIWDIKTGQQKAQLDGHSDTVQSVCFSPDGTTLASGSWDKSILIWDMRTEQQKAQLDGHTDEVNSVCFSPDGTTLASGSRDKSIRIWDIKTGQQKALLIGHCDAVKSVCFSLEGTILASGSRDNSICIWDMKTELQKAQLNGHSNVVNSVCFSPDGTTLASGSRDNSVRIWDIKTGQQKAQLNRHSNAVNSVCFSPDGTTLASGSWDMSILIWDMKTELQKAQLDRHSDTVNSVCFSPDGTTLASGSRDKSIRIWDIKTGQQKAQLDGHSDAVNSVCFSPDGTTLVSGSKDTSIRVWDIKTGQQKAQLNGHSDAVNSVYISPDGATLVSVSGDKSIRVWDMKTGKQEALLDGHSDAIQSVCYSPDGITLASGSWDKSILIWDMKTGLQLAQLDGHRDEVLSVCFSPDGITLASGGRDHSIRIWDIKTGQQKCELDGHNDRVLSVCFSPDGTTLASGSWDKSILIWDMKSGQQKVELDGHNAGVLSLCFSPDGTKLASGSRDNSIRIWDMKTELQKVQLNGHSKAVNSVCFSPDGITLASGSWDMSILIRDMKTGLQKAQLNGHRNSVNSICFSPEGNTLASGSRDNSICIWDMKTGLQKAQLCGHTNEVLSVCLSLDGTKLASGSRDNSIRIWDMKTGLQKALLNGHRNAVNSVCFSPDGTTLASGSRDHSIRIWDINIAQQKSQLDCHSDAVKSVRFSPDGNTLASGSRDNSILIWDMKTGLKRAQLNGHSNAVNSVCFSPDGIKLASGSRDHSIRIWDINTLQQKAQLDGHIDAVKSVCFSPDGTILASGSRDKSILIWDIKTKQQKILTDLCNYWIKSVCFSPDNSTFALSIDDNSIHLWDVTTGQKIAQFDGHFECVNSVFFSPDGTTLSSSSEDKTIRLWDVKTGQLITQLIGHSQGIISLCFSTNGSILASADRDKSILLWDVKKYQQIQPQDKIYNDILESFQTILPSNQNHRLAKVNYYIPLLIISQQPIFQAQATLILKGQFQNSQGIDLIKLFMKKGCFLLEDKLEQQYNFI